MPWQGGARRAKALLSAPERAFVALSLGLGALMVGAVAPFQAPDEIDHFRRAFQISEGVLVPERRPGPPGDPERLVGVTGGELPASLWAAYLVFDPLILRPDRALTPSTLDASLRIRLAPERRSFTTFANTALASPLPYLPQALGIALARLFSDRVVVLAYAGRVANLALATLLLAAAIRATPVLKWSFTALALSPMALSQSVSLSSDASTNALSFLLVAIILRCALGSRGRVGRSSLALLGLLSLALGLVKQMYLALPLAAWLIPAERLGGGLRRLGLVALLLLVAAGGTLAWGRVAQRIFSPIGPGIDPEAQLALLAANPLEFPGVVARTFASYGGAVLKQYLGVLGTLDTELPWTLLLAYAFFVLLVAAMEYEPAVRLRPGQRLVAVGVALLAFLGVCVSIHLVAGRVGERMLWLQGRYFIPLGPLLLVALYGVGRGLPGLSTHARAELPWMVPLALGGVLAVAIGLVGQRFFRLGRSEPAYFEVAALDAALREAGQYQDLGHGFAARLAPSSEDAVAHYVRAAAAETEGRRDEAVAWYREVLRLSPEAPLVASRLARLLLGRGALTAEEAAEAERLATRACRESGFEDPQELELLATAFAARGRYAHAVRTQRLAIERAKALEWMDVVRRLEARLKHYRARASRIRAS